MVEVNITNVINEVGYETIAAMSEKAKVALAHVLNADAPGNDFLGWVKLPSSTPKELVEDIEACAALLRKECEAVVVIGIGGSYLGAKAVIEALGNSFSKSKPEVLFAGQNIGEDYLYELQDYLKDKKFGIVVISKSGTTTEPAIAFRLLRDLQVKQMGEAEANKLTVAITDARKGALRKMADKQGWKTFVIEDNVGGRFSVLTPVGLLPIAVAGFDIKALLHGAAEMEDQTNVNGPENPAELYAVGRNALYSTGKKIEILVNYNPKLHYLGEWWKQLYGESEGKDHKGIFPAAVDNSTDLHSMGQWIQDGERTIFETVISVKDQNHQVVIPSDAEDLDGLNYIAGKRVDQVNKMAELGTRLAHIDGGVPQMHIEIPRLDENSLGQLLYLFEKACGISGYMLEVNPFNQPGVEDYKRNMFALLEKPGYEKETLALKQRMN